MRIAVDAMGGDHAPQVNVDGAIAAARELGISTLLVGRAKELAPLLKDSGYVGKEIEIVDASEVVGMNEPATSPIRRKRNSSIRVAANCVRDGRAEGLVSAGHTGDQHPVGDHRRAAIIRLCWTQSTQHGAAAAVASKRVFDEDP